MWGVAKKHVPPKSTGKGYAELTGWALGLDLGRARLWAERPFRCKLSSGFPRWLT
jgi:hypothetical protein